MVSVRGVGACRCCSASRASRASLSRCAMSHDLVTAGASSTRNLYERNAACTRVADLSCSSRARSRTAARASSSPACVFCAV